MANRIYDESTLRQAALLAAQMQIQEREAYQLVPALSQAALLHAQASQMGLVSSPASLSGMQQRRASTDSLASMQDNAELEPQPSSSSAAAAAGPPAQRLTKQERAAETFRRGCLRLKALQVTL
jgi:hypothetical protein